MGDWTVLLSWNRSEQGFHTECGRRGEGVQEILDFMCFPVVEQHQFTGPEVPEFVISLKWQEGDLAEYMNGSKSRAHGWRYIMSWSEHGETRVASGYGFATDQAARDAAERRATKIVRAQLPEQVYKFTPEIT